MDHYSADDAGGALPQLGMGLVQDPVQQHAFKVKARD